MLQEIFLKTIGGGINFVGLLNYRLAGNWAMRIYRKPREGRLLSADRAFLSKADLKKRVGKIGSEVMRYVWNREGEKEVLLLHGWESNAARWKPLIPILVKQNYRVVAIDAPAHGDSDNNLFDMMQYANAIDANIQLSKPEYIIGHSLGGSSLSFYLDIKNYPSFEKIILMGVPSELYNMTMNFGDMMGLTNRSIRALLDEFKEKFKLDMKNISVQKFCERINLKTLVLHDEQDDIALVSDARTYHNKLSESELFLTDGFGHSLQHEIVYQKIVNFLNQ